MPSTLSNPAADALHAHASGQGRAAPEALPHFAKHADLLPLDRHFLILLAEDIGAARALARCPPRVITGDGTIVGIVDEVHVGAARGPSAPPKIGSRRGRKESSGC